MIEVFKTDVQSHREADKLIEMINSSFPGYKVNFDLQDCDKILRIEYCSGFIFPEPVIKLLKASGFHAELLPDAVLEPLTHKATRLS